MAPLIDRMRVRVDQAAMAVAVLVDHVLPETVHGHLHCEGCGGTWEIDPEAGAVIARALEAQLGFAVDLSHVTISGWCPVCRPSEPRGPSDPD
jgi:Fe2+ or Zn2+ uptake regulation protein